MKAVVINSDGTKEVVEFDRENSYTTFRDVCEGYFQQAPLDNIGVCMYVNEEGKIYSLPQNPIATSLWVDQWAETDYMSGNVICTNLEVDDEGYEIGLTDDQVAYLMAYERTADLLLDAEGKPIFIYGGEKPTISPLPVKE